MARAISGGTISFGLVSIPVKLYAATQSSAGISFNLLHAKCNTRLKQQYICPLDNEIVSRDEMVKGYEFQKDQYVTFTTEELKAMEEKATQAIDIAEFVPLDKIDPVYFDKAYYLGPEKGGEKAYRLLAEAMRETGRSGLARYAARGKQYLVLLRPAEGVQGGGNGIVMQTLLYNDEVRPFSEVPIPEAPVRESELKLAKQLIDQIASETFDPAAYEDEVRKRLQADIDRKVDGQEIEAAPTPSEPARVIDLMEALKASLAGKKKAAGGGASVRAEGATAKAGGGAEGAGDGDEGGDEAGAAAPRAPARRPARRSATDAEGAAGSGSAGAGKAEPRKRAGKQR